MTKSYFYVFGGDDKIIITLENFAQYEHRILFSFGQAARFLEECGTDLEQKLLQLHQVENAPDIETGALLLAKYAASCAGWNRLDIRELFEGSVEDFIKSQFTKTFGFFHAQEMTVDQKKYWQHFDWKSFETDSYSWLGKRINSYFRYGDREWVIPNCYDL